MLAAFGFAKTCLENSYETNEQLFWAVEAEAYVLNIAPTHTVQDATAIIDGFRWCCVCGSAATESAWEFICVFCHKQSEEENERFEEQLTEHYDEHPFFCGEADCKFC